MIEILYRYEFAGYILCLQMVHVVGSEIFKAHMQLYIYMYLLNAGFMPKSAKHIKLIFVLYDELISLF